MIIAKLYSEKLGKRSEKRCLGCGRVLPKGFKGFVCYMCRSSGIVQAYIKSQPKRKKKRHKPKIDFGLSGL